MTVLLVALGAAVGAPLRYLTDRALAARLGTAFPWGTLAVNVTGSFLLGALVAAAPAWLLALAGTGLCGALTTYSTFGYETIRFAEARAYGYALLNAVGNLALGLAAAFAGGALFG